MAASNTTITLPNPYTPMAFVPPELETKIMGQKYAAVGSLAVFLWDTLLHLPQDYKLTIQYRITISFVIYCISRVTTLAFVFGIVVIMTTPVGNCDSYRHISILYPFTIPLTTLLFVMRVCALYDNNKYAIAFFSMTWLFVLSGAIVSPISYIGVKGTTKDCVDNRTELATILTFLPVFVHDGLIFIATSWALMRVSYSDLNVKRGIGVMVSGRHLPAFSKSILRDGQAYYLIALISNLLYAVLYFMPQAHIAPSTIGLPFFVMLNTMSSHVYRNVRFGVYRQYSINSSFIDKALQEPGQPGDPQHEIVIAVVPTSTKIERSGDLEAGDIEVTDPKSPKGI